MGIHTYENLVYIFNVGDKIQSCHHIVIDYMRFHKNAPLSSNPFIASTLALDFEVIPEDWGFLRRLLPPAPSQLLIPEDWDSFKEDFEDFIFFLSLLWTTDVNMSSLGRASAVVSNRTLAWVLFGSLGFFSLIALFVDEAFARLFVSPSMVSSLTRFSCNLSDFSFKFSTLL